MIDDCSSQEQPLQLSEAQQEPFEDGYPGDQNSDSSNNKFLLTLGTKHKGGVHQTCRLIAASSNFLMVVQPLFACSASQSVDGTFGSICLALTRLPECFDALCDLLIRGACAMTASTAISSQLQVLAAQDVVPAAEADADSDTMQSILSVLPEAVRDAVTEHLQSRQAACCPVSKPHLPCICHGLHLQMWRMS